MRKKRTIQGSIFEHYAEHEKRPAFIGEQVVIRVLRDWIQSRYRAEAHQQQHEQD